MSQNNMPKITLTKLKCLRCGHTWYPRIKYNDIITSPKNCSKCISPYWDKPVVKKSVSESSKYRVGLNK